MWAGLDLCHLDCPAYRDASRARRHAFQIRGPMRRLRRLAMLFHTGGPPAHRGSGGAFMQVGCLRRRDAMMLIVGVGPPPRPAGPIAVVPFWVLFWDDDQRIRTAPFYKDQKPSAATFGARASPSAIAIAFIGFPLPSACSQRCRNSGSGSRSVTARSTIGTRSPPHSASSSWPGEMPAAVRQPSLAGRRKRARSRLRSPCCRGFLGFVARKSWLGHIRKAADRQKATGRVGNAPPRSEETLR